MGVPKRRTSKQHIRSRRRAHRFTPAAAVACPKCKAARLPHRVCPSCGYYGDRKVLTLDAD